MAIRTINIHKHKVMMGGSDERFGFFKTLFERTMKEMSHGNVNTIDAYNMDGATQTFNAGNSDRIVVLINSTKSDGERQAVDGLPENMLPLLPASEGENVINIEYNGHIVAQFYKNLYELDILLNVSNGNDEDAKEIIEHIMNQWNELYWKPKAYENSWKHTQDRESLTERFMERMKEQARNQSRNDRDEVRRLEDNIESYKREIKRFYDNLIVKRKAVDLADERIESLQEKFIKDLDLIASHDKVSDLQVKNGRFHIFTEDIVIYDPRRNKYYFGGQYEIIINMDNTDVKFKGGTPRQGYWTGHDPHPHVSGSSSRPCLGNVSGTIAELCSRSEIYALTLVCIDFLESVNIEDSAGAKVTRWDECDETGKLLAGERRSAVVETFTCDSCGDDFDMDVRITAFNDHDGTELRGEVGVCQPCRESYYTYVDDAGAIVIDDIVGDVIDAYEEDEGVEF
jgi:hypothetical protein